MNGCVIARGRLADARKWFAHLGWNVLPRGERGRRILRWGADHAYLASPANPDASVRRWCRRWKPSLSDAELCEIVTSTAKSNKRWTQDQCATVLGVTLLDRAILDLRFIGAADDPDYEARRNIQRAKDAERARRRRAAKKTGRKRGRPKKTGDPAWKLAGASSRASFYRQRETGTKIRRKSLKLHKNDETKIPSRHISNNRKRDAIIVSPVPPISHAVITMSLVLQ